MVRPVEDRFWEKVDKESDPDGCWVWTSSTDINGYGTFYVKVDGVRCNIRAHRVSIFLETGKWPDSLFVCHKCDNPPCVRPEHLFVGKNVDNMLDRAEKHGVPWWLHQHAERHSQAKLDWSKVAEIRKMLSGGVSLAKIGKRYGVSHSTIHAIKVGRTWVKEMGEKWEPPA